MSEGDGGGGNDQYGFAERTDSMLAKLLRIDVDHGAPYAIPPTNPWARGGGVPEMFAWGLRNPWRFSFDAATGDLYIGDVGQSSFEELDVIPAGTSGQNFGWPVFEGPMCFTQDPGGNVGCDHPEQYEAPALAIDRRTTDQCAVIGGFVYRGSCALDYQGAYFWGDYCTGEVDYDLHAPKLLGTIPMLTSFGTDGFGELYATSLDGRVFRFEVTD
jgi:glucose/arabinose dehydrogenase